MLLLRLLKLLLLLLLLLLYAVVVVGTMCSSIGPQSGSESETHAETVDEVGGEGTVLLGLL